MAKAPEPILAAGGIVWRRDPKSGVPAVAIVHRNRYGDKGDWVLPKGKSKNRESFLQTALREVREETGCVAVPREFIGSMAYDANGRRKVVHFWRMEAGERLQAIDSEEVDLVRWLPLDAAVETLTYPREREFLQSTEKHGGAVKWQPSISWRHKLFDTSTARLQQELASFQVALRHPIASAGEVEQSWVTGAYALLDSACWAVQERNPELGWNCLKAAQRRGLYGLGQKELLVRAKLLLSEATEEKIGKWRNNAVSQILLENGQLKSNVDADDVTTAAEILHTHYYNTYRRLRLRSFQFACFGIAEARHRLLTDGS